MNGLVSDERWNVFPNQAWWQTPIHVNWIELLGGSVSIILHSVPMCVPQYSLLASVFMAAGCRGGVSKTPGDHHTQLLLHFRKRSSVTKFIVFFLSVLVINLYKEWFKNPSHWIRPKWGTSLPSLTGENFLKNNGVPSPPLNRRKSEFERIPWLVFWTLPY